MRVRAWVPSALNAMLLRITHETHYDYMPAVKTAQHMAHLQPCNTASQTLLHHSLHITPEPSEQSASTDVFGNTRSFFSLPSSHDSLTVVADSLVRTEPVAASSADSGSLNTTDEKAINPSWEQARERLRYQRENTFKAATEFSFASPYIPRHDDFIAYALPSFTPGRPLMQAAQDLMRRIHTDFAYESQATDVSTPTLKALAMRKGVCQDFAHVMVACLRGLGLPARYVSGYLLTQPPPGQARLVGSDASHAWASVYVPSLSPQYAGRWHDLDPTNNRAPADDYVTLAIGRDYSDVSPLRGVIHGGASHILRVAVTVAPAQESQASTP
jgi:transglutaminase-like putative cysteine protease